MNLVAVVAQLRDVLAGNCCGLGLAGSTWVVRLSSGAGRLAAHHETDLATAKIVMRMGLVK